jgi:hypothetical protein
MTTTTRDEPKAEKATVADREKAMAALAKIRERDAELLKRLAK